MGTFTKIYYCRLNVIQNTDVVQDTNGVWDNPSS